MKRKLLMLILAMCLVLTGCGMVPREEYDSVVAERDALKAENEESEYLNDYFESIDGVSVCESGDDKTKTLILACYIEMYTDGDEISRIASKIAGKLKDATTEDWFDYDYVMLEFWSDGAGRIASFTITPANLSEPMQSYEWYN
nr:MAG TPA: outer membrane protein assembly factor [Bacteriophage sp.]